MSKKMSYAGMNAMASNSMAPASALAPAVDDATAGPRQGDVQGSSAREAFRLMSTLIYPSIPMAYLDRCARILQRRHMDTVFEERAVQRLCGFPPCAKQLNNNSAKYRVSLVKKEIYDAQVENQFCSQQCMKKAKVYLSRLVAKPPQLVPSLVDVFGTDKPNPLKFEKQQEELAVAKQGEARASKGGVRRAPQAKTVWSKTGDLGIVERPGNPALDMRVPITLAATVPLIKENAAPNAPETIFPDVEKAVLIEGFVFPSHKIALAKKVERKLQETKSTSRDEEIVVSDSDESGSELESEDDYSSNSGLDASDFDSDEEEEVISSDDLPMFINLWRMLSSWITHETTLVVAGKPLPSKQEEPPAHETPKEKKQREDAERVALLVFHERYNAFSLMLNRSIAQIAQRLQLSCERYASQRIDAFIKSFSFRDAIDGRHSHQWTCIAALLLLAAHNKQVSSMTTNELSAAQTLTKLDRYELDQLLALFYALRDDNEVVVDDDVAPRPTADSDTHINKSTELTEPVKMCRKCRRVLTKCVCSARAAGKTADVSEFSTAEMTQMFRDAVTLREHYEDLVEATGGSYDEID